MTPEELSRIQEELQTSLYREMLEEKWGIYDNFVALIYGEKMDLTRRLSYAFLNSPQDHGLRERWTLYVGKYERDLESTLEAIDNGYRDSGPIFNFEAGTVNVLFHEPLKPENSFGSEYLIDGKIPPVWLSFHTYNPKKMEGPSRNVALARGIADFFGYCIRTELVARFPRLEGRRDI
jgi:hypothetical protein